MKNGSQIFELYGYPVDTWSKVAAENLSRCHCPFMEAECDGGGNRFSSGIKLTQTHPLKNYFYRKTNIQAGVCSLQLHPDEQPWIVCPRRLLNYRFGVKHDLQSAIKEKLCAKSELKKGFRYTVWPEVKMKCPVSEGDKEGLFDYTFDYVITGQARKRISDVMSIVGKSRCTTLELLSDNGFTTCRVNGDLYCDDFPSYPIVIVEVMTSSTCGGNKTKRSQVSQLFEDTIYKLNGKDVTPQGPSINYRQVWARMVSQLLVKSQIGKAWGGSTFWILQDQLVDYISKTTALDFAKFIADTKNEVNVIVGGYGKNICPENRTDDFALVNDVDFYSGPVSTAETNIKSFSDIIKLGVTPSVDELWKKLVLKRPCTKFIF